MVLPRASALASALPALRAVLQFYRSLLDDLSSLVSLDGFIVRAPPSALPRPSARQSLAAMLAVVQLLLVDAWWPLDPLDGSIVRELPSVLPRLSALARASLPCLLSSSSCWSILGGLSARSIENCFESSRRRCLAPPPSSEPSLPCLRSPRSYWLMFDGFIDSLDAIIV